MKLFHIATFGCQMNVHESEKAAGALRELGFLQTEKESDADILVFNTCSVRNTAERRAIGRIRASKGQKKDDSIVAVIGCIPQQNGYAEKFKKDFPFVDIVLGTQDLYRLGEAVLTVINQKKRVIQVSDISTSTELTEEVEAFRTSGDNAWVNIMYGCNNFCTYCIVPYVRGRERSRGQADILADCRDLVAKGYKTLTLLGQNVNSYKPNFADLLTQIASIEGDFLVRFMTSHPKDLTDEVIDIIANNAKMDKLIHLPVQAGSNAILKAMNRGYTREHYIGLINKIRAKMPNAIITTDIMVGFPGETQADFEDTLALVRHVRFDSAFTFIYSQRTGTPAEKMEQIPEAVKKERIKILIKEVKEYGKR